MDKYSQAVPDGIAKRRAQADEVEREIQEDERDMRLASFGYTFTFDRQHFWNEVNGMPSDLRKSLIRFGLSHAPSDALPPLLHQEFERLFFDDPRAANAWQEQYSDEDDSDDLVRLLRILRMVLQGES